MSQCGFVDAVEKGRESRSTLSHTKCNIYAVLYSADGRWALKGKDMARSTEI